MSDKKFQSIDELRKQAKYWRHREQLAWRKGFRDRFYMYDVNAAREKARAFEAELARRGEPVEGT